MSPIAKNHVTATADRAFLVRKRVAGVKVFGGVVLNKGVGGLNAQAVKWMGRMQGGYGRVVWFPTFDADNHVKQRGTAPSDGLAMFVAGLMAEGVTREQIQTMGREVPGALLMG